MRVAVVDIGTNSTRLLAAEVDPTTQAIAELERRSVVTRLGEGVDSKGHLGEQAAARTLAVLRDYATAIETLACERNLAVLTSAVRDADNGASFSEQVRAFSLDAQVLTGDQEAQLTFLGAMSSRPQSPDPTVVIDIGGGSTEFIVGSNHTPTFHTSLQAGVVRMSERHIHTDPPAQDEIEALAADVRRIFDAGLAAETRRSAHSAIAVAGTATSAAAIDQRLDPYDPAKVDGYTLRRTTVKSLLQSLAGMTEAQRRDVPGLHPDRAPTIVAGMVMLSEAIGAFELQEVEVSERDILHGGVLKLAGID